MTRESVDVLIVGAGPAGMSTALHLAHADAAWADRVVVLERAVHPRDKLCGGGISGGGDRVLAVLGLTYPCPQVAIRAAEFRYAGRTCTLRGDPALRIVRRAEFDHWLVRSGEARGLRIRQGETVRAVNPDDTGVDVDTDRGAYRARVVVGADGSGGVVRRALGSATHPTTARTLDVLTPEPPDTPAFRDGVAVFDFTAVARGLQGYYWEFPSLIDGAPVMNRGVFDSRAQPRRSPAALGDILAQSMGVGGQSEPTVRSFPIHWLQHRARIARPRLLLAGDAAGVDALLGEGIAFALAYGDVAAGAIVDAFARDDFTFRDYGRRVRRHPLLATLTTRNRLARLLYAAGRPWQQHALWTAFSLIVRLRRALV